VLEDMAGTFRENAPKLNPYIGPSLQTDRQMMPGMSDKKRGTMWSDPSNRQRTGAKSTMIIFF